MPTLLKSIPLNSDLYYFAGWTDGKCYLANPHAPLDLLELKDAIQTTIHINILNTVNIQVGKISLDSPSFFLADLNAYTIYKGDVKNWKIDRTLVKQKFFSEFLPIPSSSTILRTLNEDRSLYILSKEGANHERVSESSELIQKQIDGLFCTDGMLLFDKVDKRILYTYYYRNQFICADTSLNLLFRARTIDTTTTAKIRVAKIESMGVSTLASPPALVNRATFANNGMLFINSNLSGDNENPAVFRSHDAIDIYDSWTGQYQYSFYIPRQQNKRLRAFAIHSEKLYVLRGMWLEIYNHNLN